MKEHSLSYGIDLRDRSLADEKHIIDKYQKYLSSIYMGLPDKETNMVFTGRPTRFFENYDVNQYIELMDYARERGIKINFTINSINDLDASKVNNRSFSTGRFDSQLTPYLNRSLEIIQKYQPDEICTLDHLVDFYRNSYSCNYIRSFHEGYPTQDIIDKYKFNTYVIRNTYFWVEKKPIEEVENRIVLNVACCVMCRGCKNGDSNPHSILSNSDEGHTKRFYKELGDLSKGSFETYIAQHGWFGRDLQLIEETYPEINITYKVANRGIYMNTQTTEMLLDNYVSAEPVKFNEHNIMKFCDNHGIHEYTKNYNFNNFDYQLFKEEKLKYWQSINSSIKIY